MAYTAPTISSSSQTWNNLLARGFSAFARQVGVANSASQAQLNLINSILNPQGVELVIARLNNTVDNYTRGKSDKTNAKAYVLDLNFALKAINQALEEIGTLVDAN